MDAKNLINQLFDKTYTFAGIDQDMVARFKQYNLDDAILKWEESDGKTEENKPSPESIELTEEQKEKAKFLIKIDAFNYADFFKMQVLTTYVLDAYMSEDYGLQRMENLVKMFERIKIARIGGRNILADVGFDFLQMFDVIHRIWQKVELAMVELKKNSGGNLAGDRG